jgi:type II secretion system protein G
MNMSTPHKLRNTGFTLIELLVVIAIIGVLASVVLASLNSARAKSRDARRIADLKQIQTALELYYDANLSYPQPSQGWG